MLKNSTNKLKLSLIRTAVLFAVLFSSAYFVSCDAGGSVATKQSAECETKNTAELTLATESESVTYSVYLDGTYLGPVKKNISKTTTVSAGVDHRIEFKVDGVLKCPAVTKRLVKCTSESVACSN